MEIYKFTEHNNRTKHDCLWVPGMYNTATGQEGCLCTSSWLHCYNDIRAAIMFHSNHIFYANGRLWKGEVPDDARVLYGMLKMGATKMRVIERVDVFEIPRDKYVELAARIAVRIMEKINIEMRHPAWWSIHAKWVVDDLLAWCNDRSHTMMYNADSPEFQWHLCLNDMFIHALQRIYNGIQSLKYGAQESMRRDPYKIEAWTHAVKAFDFFECHEGYERMLNCLEVSKLMNDCGIEPINELANQVSMYEEGLR